MKKNILLSLLLIAGIATNSCIYEKVSEDIGVTPPPPPPPPIGSVKKTFNLRFLPGGTVDSMAVNTYAGPSFIIDKGTPVLRWGESESAGLFMTGSADALLYANRKYDFNRSTLSYTDTVTTDLTTATLYGYTPYQAAISGTTVSYTLDPVQNQSPDNATEYGMDNALEKNVFTIAAPSASFELAGGTCSMTYQSIFAFLRLQVWNPFNIFDQQRIVSAQLYVADTTAIEKPVESYALAGSYTVDVSKAPETAGYSGPVFGSDRSHKITSTVTGGTVISNSDSPYLWFVLNPVKMKPSERLVSIIETRSGYRVISQHDLSELKPNAIFISTIEANEQNTVSSQIREISDGKSANTHIAPSAGIYRMYLKKVNGTAPLTGQSVDWLWASKKGGGSSFNINELIDPASIKYNAAGYVDFRVGTDFGKYTEGNVVLALKDASGNIVWTWHIWITDDLQDAPYDGMQFLDRNIGALSADTLSPAIDTYGFVYQWGRKDPFVGGDGVTYDDANMPSYANNRTLVNPSAPGWSQASGTTIEDAWKNPMQFFYNTASSGDAPADWLYRSDAGLWAGDGKTDYDPCPYGYKVPDKDELTVLQSAYERYRSYLDDVEAGISGPDPATWSTSWFYNSENSNRYWVHSYDKTPTFWPLAGMRVGRSAGAQLKYAGTDNRMGRAFYWTATPFVPGGSPVPGASHRVEAGNSSENLPILYSPDTFGDNADAYPVRCVKMQ